MEREKWLRSATEIRNSLISFSISTKIINKIGLGAHPETFSLILNFFDASKPQKLPYNQIERHDDGIEKSFTGFADKN